MAEVSVFDAYQVQRALRGHLADDDALETLARDDATGAFWVLTRAELIVMRDMQIGERIPRGALVGEVEVSDVAVTIRLRATDAAPALVGTFRKPNRFTKALGEVVEGNPR
jgi:hypothetical protein